MEHVQIVLGMILLAMQTSALLVCNIHPLIEISDTTASNMSPKGFENTWMWAEECKSGNQITWSCGNLTGSANNYALPCPSNEVAFTDWVTTVSTTSVGRYTPPPSVNTKLFTVITSSYTVTMTADSETATLTTTFESTFTSAFSPTTSGSTAAATAATATSNSPSTSNSPTQNTKKSGLGLGAIIAIIAIPVVLIAIGLGLFFFFRAKRSKGEDPIRLNSAVPPPPPPPNGPVGDDQVYPYEAAGNEINRPQHNYYGPKVDTYEIDDRNAVLRGEKSPAVYGGNGYQNGGGQQRAELNSPAPAYSYGGPFAVEMDATPVVRHQAP